MYLDSKEPWDTEIKSVELLLDNSHKIKVPYVAPCFNLPNSTSVSF
jgi:hypothetical protein